MNTIMKKFFVCFVITLLSVSVNAQVSWKVKAGLGVMTSEHGEGNLAYSLGAEADIPLGFTRMWVFSPSFNVAVTDSDCKEGSYTVADLELLAGRQIPVGSEGVIIPKVGGMIGSMHGSVAPEIGCDYDYKHLTIGVRGYYSIERAKVYINYSSAYSRYNPYGVFLKAGYKF